MCWNVLAHCTTPRYGKHTSRYTPRSSVLIKAPGGVSLTPAPRPLVTTQAIHAYAHAHAHANIEAACLLVDIHVLGVRKKVAIAYPFHIVCNCKPFFFFKNLLGAADLLSGMPTLGMLSGAEACGSVPGHNGHHGLRAVTFANGGDEHGILHNVPQDALPVGSTVQLVPGIVTRGLSFDSNQMRLHYCCVDVWIGTTVVVAAVVVPLLFEGVWRVCACVRTRARERERVRELDRSLLFIRLCYYAFAVCV